MMSRWAVQKEIHKSLRGCGCRQKERVGVQTKRTERWAPVVTTKRRLRWVQPPRLGVRRASSAAPRVLVLLRSHSERGSEVRGRRNCITTNYDKLYTMYLMYYVCATRSETYPMPSLGSEWSEVRVPSPRWSRCRFQSNRNRSVTTPRSPEFEMGFNPVSQPGHVWANPTSHSSSLELVWWERIKPLNMAACRRFLREAVKTLSR